MPNHLGEIIIERKGKYYLVTFTKGIFGIATHNVISDKEGKIIGDMLLHVQDYIEISSHDNEKHCFTYEGFGKVYFNIQGDIIWITYFD